MQQSVSNPSFLFGAYQTAGNPDPGLYDHAYPADQPTLPMPNFGHSAQVNYAGQSYAKASPQGLNAKHQAAAPLLMPLHTQNAGALGLPKASARASTAHMATMASHPGPSGVPSSPALLVN